MPPKWNNRIYLILNLEENNTHISTQHTITCKQLSKLGQTTKRHVNTQGPCRRPDITQIFNPKVYQAHKPPIPSCASWASAAVILNLTQLTWIITFARGPGFKSQTSPQNCNIPGGMLWDGSGYHHVCAWECVGWMLSYLFPLLTPVLLRLLAGYCCAKVTYFTLSYSLYTIFRNQTRSKIFNHAFYSTTTKI